MDSRSTGTRAERNEGRPAHVRDFDLNFGLHNLREAAGAPHLRVWRTPLWQNVVGLIFSAIFVVACLIVRHTNPEIAIPPKSPWVLALWAVGGVMLGVALLILIGLTLHRGRLVLDRPARCLCFYRILLWPRPVWCLSLDDIAALATKELTVPDADVDSTPWTYDIVFAELRDGRLASIAFDSVPSVRAEISAALT